MQLLYLYIVFTILFILVIIVSSVESKWAISLPLANVMQ